MGMVTSLQRWACNFFISPQIANPHILGLFPQSQISEVCQSANRKSATCVMINPQNAKLQIFKGKSSVSDPDPLWFTSNIF
jgi:hypothetical protein